MIDESQQRDLVASLNRIEGQLRGIRKMIEEPRVCIDIMQQLAAARAALGRVSGTLLRYHVENCVPDALQNGGADQDRNLAELVNIVDRFAR